MGEVIIHGLTVDGMKVSILTIKNMDMVSIHGQMERNMMDNGLMENNMEKANSQILKARVK